MKPDERRASETIAVNEESLQPVMVEIMRSIKNVRFGSIEITIHDSRVVQIERKEKMRFATASRSRTS